MPVHPSSTDNYPYQLSVVIFNVRSFVVLCNTLLLQHELTFSYSWSCVQQVKGQETSLMETLPTVSSDWERWLPRDDQLVLDIKLNELSKVCSSPVVLVQDVLGQLERGALSSSGAEIYCGFLGNSAD